MNTTEIGAQPVPRNKNRRVAFIGQPNTGKSTFFNRVTNATAGVANWPGLTVDLMSAEITKDDKTIEFVDLPGIYDLDGFTEDEKVVQDFLQRESIDLIVCVINASQIDRQIMMPLQIKSLGLPCLVVLNMADEVKRFGVKINTAQLSEHLGMPVFTISAKYGSGCGIAIDGIWKTVNKLEDSYKVVELVQCCRANRITEADMKNAMDHGIVMPPTNLVTFTNRMDAVLLHPVFGLPIFFLSMLLLFLFIWNVGMPAQDPVADFTDWFQEAALEPGLSFLPDGVKDFIISGPYTGFASLLGFVPLVAFFFVVMNTQGMRRTTSGRLFDRK